MQIAQRNVLLVASGAATVVIVVAVNRMIDGSADGGWFMYAPNSDTAFVPASSNGDGLRAAVVWLAGIAGWTALAWWLCRRRPAA